MQTHSQYGQDLWAFHTLGGKTNGFFIEMGAFDGITGSNTLMLERVGWRGICVEPMAWCFERLCENRACICVKALVAGRERTSALFLQSSDQVSGIADHRAWQTPAARAIDMKTRPMADLLRQCRAPRHIDYFSLDVEGAEIEILLDFPYAEYAVGLFTIEHNATSFPERIGVKNQMCDILAAQGYRYVGDLGDDGLFCKPQLYDQALRALQRRTDPDREQATRR